MRLKRVKIFGFKTFADKTEFDIDGDLIAVVGSNGCGKSNLVDAILWGLGEGSVKHLRAGSSQDVIFSGTSRRKALGFAEVTLLFDNEDGSLPLESSEVSITRRLTRSGESEYMINRQHCRQRDILDLLADSGLGRSGYAIVGQSDIDQALATSAEDRRAWVDEAAGVQRYRARKLESLKRLHSAHQHLERVGDIIREIETQREPLREEAEAAKRYRSIQTSLREVETGLLIVEVAGAIRQIQALEDRIAQATSMASSLLKEADDLESAGNQETLKAAEIEQKLEVERGRLQVATTSFERAVAAIRLLEQRIQSLDALERNMGEESEQSRIRIEEAELEVASARNEAAHEDSALENLRAECAGAGEAADSLRSELRKAETELAAAREQHNRHMRSLAEAEQRSNRLAVLARERRGAEKTLPDLEQGVAEAAASLQSAENDLILAEGKLSDHRAQLLQLEERESSETSVLRDLLAEIAVLDGRRRGIESTIEAHEGLAQGARAVLEAKSNGLLRGEYIPVGKAISASKELAVAIETALGAAANDLIVPSEREAKDAIALLKENRMGRATFQPLTLMRTSNIRDRSLEGLLQHPGVVGIASQLVKCEDRYRPVVDSLLGRVLVVRTIDDSFALANTTGWNRIVTVDGEVLHQSGAVTGGVAAKQHYGLVQRKADLEEIEKKLQALRKLASASENEKKANTERRQALTEMVVVLQSSIREKELAIREARKWHDSIQSELTATLRSIEKLRQEESSLQSAPQADAQPLDLTQLEARRDTLIKQLAGRTADAEVAEARLREAESRLAQARLRVETASRRLSAARDLERQRAAKIENLTPERERIAHEIENTTRDRAAAEEQTLQAQRQIEHLSEARKAATEHAQQLIQKARTARSDAQACTDSCHQAELQRARADAKRATALQRLMEEYGLSEEDALEQEPITEVPADAAALAQKLRKELRALGDVNLGAIEAYERLSERYVELTAQRADILEGIGQVEESVKELDKLTRDRFLGTFEALQNAFEEIFGKLFGGGEGKLILTRPDDILETGVEIDVTLPGKKKQRLELLSGGERSLCAAAFLFALLKVKPSPLVVLDEVDAPLDGRNVERYLDLVKEFSATMQFILITHNPTTIEAAPTWLGVTMQEPGVSTLVPVRMTPSNTKAVVGAALA
jgi:chromosome segregation protein